MWIIIIILTQSYIVWPPKIHTAIPNVDSFTAKYVHNQKHWLPVTLKDRSSLLVNEICFLLLNHSLPKSSGQLLSSPRDQTGSFTSAWSRVLFE